MITVDTFCPLTSATAVLSTLHELSQLVLQQPSEVNRIILFNVIDENMKTEPGKGTHPKAQSASACHNEGWLPLKTHASSSNGEVWLANNC